MDMKTILRDYMRSRKVAKNIKNFQDAQRYAEEIGQVLADSLGDDFTGIDEDELALMLRDTLKHAYNDASAAAAIAQRLQNRQAGLGLGTLRAEFDTAEVQKIAAELAGKTVSREFVRNLVIQKTVNAVDETIRKNAEAQSDIGLNVHIVRTYSDVGLRAGTKYAEPCQWCMERCGEWTDYQEAYAAGVFERHPGCLCEIEYEVGKTHTRSTGGGWVNV